MSDDIGPQGPSGEQGDGRDWRDTKRKKWWEDSDKVGSIFATLSLFVLFASIIFIMVLLCIKLAQNVL